MEMLNNLFIRYMNNECTMQEINQLLLHFKVVENEAKLKELIISALNAPDVQRADLEEDEQILDSKLSLWYNDIKQNIEKESTAPVKTRSLKQWYGIAAGIALICCIGLFYRNLKPQAPQKELAYHIEPGKNKAILILADGGQLDLFKAKNGILAKQGAINISKTADGQLNYSAKPDGAASSVAYNKIEVPKGGQYQVRLSDGTQVWLNSASTIKYPTSFAGKTRNVTLSGEAYFEVAKNKNQPFIVNVNDVTVQVIGTHFNIMAYHDEPSIHTTLLEGSVKVSKSGLSKMMIPGQEALINKDIQLIKANVDEAVAWKNANFLFDNLDVPSAMRKIERWYNVKVVYSGELPVKHLNGKIPKNTDLKKLLSVLELMGGIHFKVEQDVITVSK